MMNYHFAPHLLLRMPVKTPGDYTNGVRIFLNDQFFRLLIDTTCFNGHTCFLSVFIQHPVVQASELHKEVNPQPLK